MVKAKPSAKKTARKPAKKAGKRPSTLEEYLWTCRGGLRGCQNLRGPTCPEFRELAAQAFLAARERYPELDPTTIAFGGQYTDVDRFPQVFVYYLAHRIEPDQCDALLISPSGRIYQAGEEIERQPNGEVWPVVVETRPPKCREGGHRLQPMSKAKAVEAVATFVAEAQRRVDVAIAKCHYCGHLWTVTNWLAETVGAAGKWSWGEYCSDLCANNAWAPKPKIYSPAFDRWMHDAIAHCPCDTSAETILDEHIRPERHQMRTAEILKRPIFPTARMEAAS